ncbi:MAG: PEP-CTERM sorting domain-containing protein, partial [bacterium]|nr:PEP-CTERM sorting domain-containing protein [bacterium]
PGFQAVASTTGTGGRAFVLGGLPSDFFSNADYRLGLQARATGLSTGFEEFSLAVVPEPSAIYLLSFVAVGILTRHRVKVHASRRI